MSALKIKHNVELYIHICIKYLSNVVSGVVVNENSDNTVYIDTYNKSRAPTLKIMRDFVPKLVLSYCVTSKFY